jgi:hypothetical protein
MKVEVGKYYLVKWVSYKCVIRVALDGHFIVLADSCPSSFVGQRHLIPPIQLPFKIIKEIPKHELPIYIMEMMK